ncbi:MAG: ribosome maturation factor RimP [Deltaproteobacteria bacterium]|nr:ribosome maturation factor RimP [Deltaproteobacteria bacterium]
MDNVKTKQDIENSLAELLRPSLEPLGYEIIHLEAFTQRERILRIFIDHPQKQSIGIEDCTLVSRTLDPVLEKLQETKTLFRSSYSLEVSSPGLNRPLKKTKDFERFLEQKVRIEALHHLTADELENSEYQQTTQKVFFGTLKEVYPEKIVLALPEKKSKSKKTEVTNFRVCIPFSLIKKANLEPEWPLHTKEHKESE